MTNHNADLEAALADLASGRAELVSAVQHLADADLERARRGGWTVRRTLEHVLQSEWLYVSLLGFLCGKAGEARPPASCAGQAPDEILCQLDLSRAALLVAVEGVDEGAFYEIKRVGHEEYSVLSVLENAAHHDREHADQVRRTLAEK